MNARVDLCLRGLALVLFKILLMQSDRWRRVREGRLLNVALRAARSLVPPLTGANDKCLEIVYTIVESIL